MKLLFLVLLFGLRFIAPVRGSESLSSESDPLQVPFRNDLIVDGHLKDWISGGYTLARLFSDEVGRTGSLDANVRLAWGEEALFVAVLVVDDVIAEAPGFSLWQGDGLVLHIASESGDHPILFMLTPGIGVRGEVIPIRTLINDHRTGQLKDTEFKPSYATRPTKEGYQMELAIPLSSLGLLAPAVGDLVSLQVEVKDREEDTEKAGLQWNPNLNATRNAKALHKIRLSKEADHRPQTVAMGRVVDERLAGVVVYGDTVLGGMPVRVEFPGERSDEGVFSVKPGNAFAHAIIGSEFPKNAEEAWIAEVFCGDQRISQIDFTTVPWVDSQEGFAPIPSLVAMKAFELDRKENQYSKEAVLAIGSSSIRFWDTIEEDLAPWEIIKRGFGGSAMSDVVGAHRYLIESYDVNRFLIYEGDTESGREMPEAFLRYARIFVERLAVERPKAVIVFLTPKPSPKRFSLWGSSYKIANEGLVALVDQYPNVHLIDVASPLFNENGSLRSELFKTDGVHLNDAGYDVWEAVITPELEKFF